MFADEEDLLKISAKTTHALPLDVFRIGVGVLSMMHFLRSIFEAPYFTGSDGLINHALLQEIYWYTWQPLFTPAMSTTTIQLILFLGVLLSLGLILGIRSRLTALALYAIVVCLYRYHFLVTFVDDVIMHLLLFWCVLLPVGKTLTITGWRKPNSPPGAWKETRVDGFLLNLFLFNIALIYFVAGVSKYTSPLWMNGTALLAVMKLPLGWYSSFALEKLEPWLKFGNYAALVFEPLFVLLVLLKPWSKLKLFLGASLAFFHLFIILTIDVPIANLGCLICVPIIFRHELMDLLRPKESLSRILPLGQRRLVSSDYLGISFVFLLTGAMACSLLQDQWRQAPRVTGKIREAQVKLSSAESGGKIQTAFYGGLWILGLAQGYRLLDWIDERNFSQEIKIIETGPDTKFTFGRSKLVPPGMRGSLLLSYISEVTWMHVPPTKIDELRRDIKSRLSAMYCRKAQANTSVAVWHTITRIDSYTPKKNPASILMRFDCRAKG